MNTTIELDKKRYANGKMPAFQRYYRKCQEKHGRLTHLCYRALFAYWKRKSHIDLSYETEIGDGLYFGHPYCISINPKVTIGNNFCIHKGATIGQENRGKRKGVPVIGDDVWIGVNATVVGNVKIGSDVMIAPNSFVNCDIPSHSVVFGNPCIVKHKESATVGYINRRV